MAPFRNCSGETCLLKKPDTNVGLRFCSVKIRHIYCFHLTRREGRRDKEIMNKPSCWALGCRINTLTNVHDNNLLCHQAANPRLHHFKICTLTPGWGTDFIHWIKKRLMTQNIFARIKRLSYSLQPPKFPEIPRRVVQLLHHAKQSLFLEIDVSWRVLLEFSYFSCEHPGLYF